MRRRRTWAGVLVVVPLLALLGRSSAGAAATNGTITGVAFIECQIVLNFPVPFPTPAPNNCDGLAAGVWEYATFPGNPFFPQTGVLAGNHNPPKGGKPLIDPLWKLGLDKPPPSSFPSKQEPWQNFHAFDIEYGQTCPINTGPPLVGGAQGNATLYLNSTPADTKPIAKGADGQEYTLVVGHGGGPGFQYNRIGNVAMVRVFDVGLYKGKVGKKTTPGKTTAKVSMNSPIPGVVPIGHGTFKFIPRLDKAVPGNCADFPIGVPTKIQLKGVVILGP